jgi:hypothetical protein
MPIRKEDRARYPANWRELAVEIKAANNYECGECGQMCRRPGDTAEGMSRAERTRQTLTIAHYDHCYDAPEIFVAALCSGCHLRHDARAAWASRRRNVRVRQRLAGQMEFLQEERVI